MRRVAPWALLVVLVIGGTAGAALGISAHDGPAPASAVTTSPQVPQFAGLTVQQALQLAHTRGVSVRIWQLPASAPAGTVMEQLSDQPVFLVVSAGPLRHNRAVLAHAVGPPVFPECAPGFRLDADGNAGPATCSGHEVNAATWDFFAASSPPMLGLGRTASRCGVAAAYDDDQLTASMNFTVFELANAYYGWRFGPAFTDQLASSGAHAGGCGGG